MASVEQPREVNRRLMTRTTAELLENASVRLQLPGGKADPGPVFGSSGKADAAIDAFMQALAKHRHFERESDPPIV